MPHIPQDDVVGTVEHPVQGHGEFDDTEVGAEVATVAVHGLDHPDTDFIGQL